MSYDVNYTRINKYLSSRLYVSHSSSVVYSKSIEHGFCGQDAESCDTTSLFKYNLDIKCIFLILVTLSCQIFDANAFIHNNDSDSIDDYLNNIVDTRICNGYKSDSLLNLKQAINITVACNRNIQKNLVNRISTNYSLEVAKYKFKPNINISMRAHYEKMDNDITTDTNRAANIIPQFRILTPLGTVVNLDWENYVSNPHNVNTFRNASRIIIRQPLLKQSGIDYQTVSIKNAEAANHFDNIRMYDLIANEINNTIFSFRQVIQNQHQLDIQLKSLDISKKLYHQTSALIKAGRLARYELSQVDSQVASQEINLADAEINLYQSYRDLANQLGIDIENIRVQLDKDLDVPAPPIAANTIEFKTILNNNISYINLLLQQKNTEQEYHVAYDQSRWTLDITASYQLESNENTYKRSLQNYFSFSDQKKFLGLEFDIPFDLNPSRNQALIENKVRLKQLALEKKQLEQEIYSDFQGKLYQQQLLWNKLQLSQKSFKIKKENFKMATKKYEVGRLSAFELGKIQDELESSKVLEKNNLMAYLNNQTILDKMQNRTLNKWGIELNIK